MLGDRAYLTDEEVATLRARASELFNGETDAAFGGSVFETVLEGADDYQSGDGVTSETPDGTGNYNQFWLVDREFDNRTSLIVDPPSGRLPARTAEADQRAEARQRADEPIRPIRTATRTTMTAVSPMVCQGRVPGITATSRSCRHRPTSRSSRR